MSCSIKERVPYNLAIFDNLSVYFRNTSNIEEKDTAEFVGFWYVNENMLYCNNLKVT